jgi:hypothetical protein
VQHRDHGASLHLPGFIRMSDGYIFKGMTLQLALSI